MKSLSVEFWNKFHVKFKYVEWNVFQNFMKFGNKVHCRLQSDWLASLPIHLPIHSYVHLYIFQWLQGSSDCKIFRNPFGIFLIFHGFGATISANLWVPMPEGYFTWQKSVRDFYYNKRISERFLQIGILLRGYEISKQ